MQYQLTPLPAGALPTTDQAAYLYSTQGGELKAFSLFGKDPLRIRPDLVGRRDLLFASANPSYCDIFSKTVNGNSSFERSNP